jgi:hypothetical protein
MAAVLCSIKENGKTDSCIFSISLRDFEKLGESFPTRKIVVKAPKEKNYYLNGKFVY